MTTFLHKPVAREIAASRHGPMIVTIATEGIYYREKGRRKAFLLPHGVAFLRAVDLHIARERAEKKAARIARRKERGR